MTKVLPLIVLMTLIITKTAISAESQCSTIERYVGLQYGDVISLFEKDCLATLTPPQLTFTAGLAQGILEQCGLPRSFDDLGTIGTFLSSSMWVGIGQGRDRSNPDLTESLRSGATSSAAYLAGVKTLDLIGGCENAAIPKISAGIVKFLNRTASVPRFVDGCATYYSGRYSRSQCQCLADVSRAVFPDVHQRAFSPSIIKELINRNPFVGVQAGIQCRIGDY